MIWSLILGIFVGLAIGWMVHAWVFAHYDAWIVENGGKLPPPGTP